MTGRQGEITRVDLKRKWPHHVALPAQKVRDELIYWLQRSYSAVLLTNSLCRVPATSWCSSPGSAPTDAPDLGWLPAMVEFFAYIHQTREKSPNP
jgi:hypothetical protein